MTRGLAIRKDRLEEARFELQLVRCGWEHWSGLDGDCLPALAARQIVQLGGQLLVIECGRRPAGNLFIDISLQPVCVFDGSVLASDQLVWFSKTTDVRVLADRKLI